MRARGYLGISGLMFLLISPLPAIAAQYQDLSELRQTVEQHVSKRYQTDGDAGRQVSINVGTLDPRLRLHQCDQPLDLSIKAPPQGQGNITVKTACTGSQPWTVYIPARVDIFAQVAVASKSLARGHLVSEADISFQRSNTSQLGFGHISEKHRLVGMVLERPMRAGEVFRLSGIEQPQVVQRGDSVMVEAQAGSLNVVAPGKALGSGKVGEQIRVENSQSQRIIDARIVAPGRVEVVL